MFDRMVCRSCGRRCLWLPGKTLCNACQVEKEMGPTPKLSALKARALKEKP